jgi:hypothetical protein
MKGVVYSFLYKYYSYIKVYGTTRAPHLLPYFVPKYFLMRDIAYQTMGSGMTALLEIRSKKIWPFFPIHIRSYTISNGQHARKEAEALKYFIMVLGDPKGHDPHELEIIHVIYVGLTHSSIHVVDFEENKFKGILSYDEILHNLPHDASKWELQHEKEEIKRVTLNQFKILLQQAQDTDITREQEKTRKEEKLEQKRLQA